MADLPLYTRVLASPHAHNILCEIIFGIAVYFSRVVHLVRSSKHDIRHALARRHSRQYKQIRSHNGN